MQRQSRCCRRCRHLQRTEKCCRRYGDFLLHMRNFYICIIMRDTQIYNGITYRIDAVEVRNNLRNLDQNGYQDDVKN